MHLSPNRLTTTALGFPALVLVGCVATHNTVDIEGHDGDRLLPKLALSFPVDRSRADTSAPMNRLGNGWTDPFAPIASTHEDLPPALDMVSFIDIELGYAGGEFGQELNGTDQIVFLRDRVTGPAQVTTDYELITGSITGRAGIRAAHGILGVDGIVGLGAQNAELESVSGSIREHANLFSMGPVVGGRVTIQPVRFLEVYADARYTLGFARDLTGLGAAEVGVEVSPVPGAAIILGYRWWRYLEERDDTIRTTLSVDRSDVDVQVSGLLIGARFTF